MRKLTRSFLGLSILLFASTTALSQSQPEFTPVNGRLAAALFKPDTGSAHVGLVVANGGSSSMSHIACRELAARGFMLACMTTRWEGGGSSDRGGWENVALDIKGAIELLKSKGATKIVLFGHSGGGSVMSFYQAVAENGVAHCQGPNKLSQCDNALAGLPVPDGIILADAHAGLAVMDLRMGNPSLITEGNPPKTRIDSSLDPFDPANGYRADGTTHYSQDFIARYGAAQAKRTATLIATAQAIQAQIKAGTLQSPANDVLVVPGDSGASLVNLDNALPDLMSSAKPQRLLQNDGSIVTGVVKSTGVSVQGLEKEKLSPDNVRVWRSAAYLSRAAVRATDAVDNIEYCSSNTVTACNAAAIRKPVLIAAMGGHRFIGDNERMYDRSPSPDKDFIIVEGATHGFTPCAPCEKTPGQYSNATKNFFDYAAAWMQKRF